MSDIDLDAAERTVGQISAGGGKTCAMTLDVTEEAAWRGTVDRIPHDFGRLDVLVNNTGVPLNKLVTEMTLAEWRRGMAVNLEGVFLGTKYAMSAMKQGRREHHQCRIAVRDQAQRRCKRLLCQQGSGADFLENRGGGVKTPMWEKMDFLRDLVFEHGGPEEAFAAMAGPQPSHAFS